MLKFKKPFSLLIYFMLSLFFMEIIFRIATSTKILTSGLIISLIFLISLSIILYLICSLFKDKINHILSIALLTVVSFIFASQFIYFKFFRTFYSLYSAGNSAQILDFWKDILSATVKNSFWILLFFIPVILIIILGKKMLSFSKISKLPRIIFIFLILISHLIGVGTVYMNNSGQYSAYDLYFKNNYPILSIQKIGLITTMRIDLQRLVSGWSPVVEVSTTAYLPTNLSPSEKILLDNVLTEDSNGFKNATAIEKKVKGVKIEYNILDIPFGQLIANEENKNIKAIHTYFSNLEPTAKNEFTGKYEGYNLIFITAESFSPYAVNKDLTPTLYKMVHKGYNFTNFYNPIWGVSTSDGEYVACTGLIPKSGVWSFYKSGAIELPFVMGNQLKDIGYKTIAYHNHTYSYYRRDISHPNMGYEYKALGHGLDVKETWPESDIEMMEKTIPEYINEEPFHAYYMTVSGHMQYSFSGNYIALKNKEYVADLPYSEQAKAYIATQIELDKALEYLLKELEEAGLADKTLIVMSADHYPYGLEYKTIDELAGHDVEHTFELYKSPLIIYTENIEPITIDKPCSSLDINPTISNLLGLEYDSRLLMGSDIFSNSTPLVVFLDKSFITDKGRYDAKTGRFTPVDGIKVNQDYIDKVSAFVDSKFHFSAKILETDYYSKILKKE